MEVEGGLLLVDPCPTRAEKDALYTRMIERFDNAAGVRTESGRAYKRPVRNVMKYMFVSACGLYAHHPFRPSPSLVLSLRS